MRLISFNRYIATGVISTGSLLFIPYPSSAITVSVGTTPAPVFSKTKIKSDSKHDTKQPVLLTARQVDYDKERSLVSASGKVEVVQGEIILLADHIIYDQKENVVTASGNISVLEASGNVVFADKLELKDDMKKGVIGQFKARLNDDSLFAANSAKKINENVTELHQAVYSPCKVCRSETEENYPLWQLEADHIVIDKEKQKVSYENAFMEIYNIPIFYTPYFSHPTPGADNKSGLLAPTLKQSTNLGTVYKQPIYYSIEADKDITVTPIYTSLEGPVLDGEYRQLFNNGTLNLSGSITKPQTRDAGGVVSKGQDIRGHFSGEGHFHTKDKTNLGFSINKTSDDTYLRRYDISDDSFLTSRIYAEKYDFIGDNKLKNHMRSAFDIQALEFDGLTADDDNRISPRILPLVNFDWQSEKGEYDDRFLINANIMALTRRQGTESRRISTTAGWNLPYITEDGQIIELNAAVRTDLYWIDDFTLVNGNNFSGKTTRVLPSASVTWRYPFINNLENSNILIEPIVMLATSAKSGNSGKIPNEDSSIPEFNTSNLFSPNRFAGYDRVETGAQASYGIRGHAQFPDNKYVNWLVGQHYRRDTNNNFPYSNNSSNKFSDYVGNIGVYYDPFSVSYRTRLDKDSLAFNQNEVNALFNYYPVYLSSSYLSLKNDPTLQNREEISGALAINLTKQWIWGVSATRDLQINDISNASTSLTFNNECIYITNSFGRNYTSDRDIKPSTTYMFQISFKNLD
ncbi:MAG: LPS assembly protein LptD [Rickettsiales bacterium]